MDPMHVPIQKRLLEQRDMLTTLLRKMADEQDTSEDGFVPPSTHGQDDEAERVVGLQMGMMTRSNLVETLKEIEEALLRIDRGTYGLCVDCGQRIAAKRLEFSPGARYCIECQIKHEGM